MSLSDLLRTSPPDVAIAIDASHVVAARLSGKAPAFSLSAHAVEPLPPGAVVPSLGAPNIADVGQVSRTIAAALGRLGGRVTRAALVIPDTAAKVSLVRFETVPASPADLDALVRWQVRKSAPFPVDQAAMSFTPGAPHPAGGREFVVVLARRDIVAEYEHTCELAGVHPGLVDLATFSIINGVLAGGSAPSGDWLLVHAASTYTTVAVMRGEHLIFFRNREQENEGTLADVVHQTAMYYEDRLQGAGFGRVLLAGDAVRSADAVRRSLEQRMDVRIEPVSPPDLAPLSGILLRERRAA